MLTSVIVPVFNQLRYTKLFVNSVMGFTPPDELVVVDNGSTDGTREFLIEAGTNYPNMLVISHNTNMGFGYAMNRGMEQSRGDLLLFMNNDIKIIDIDWLEEVRRSVSASPDECMFSTNLVVDNELTRLVDGRPIPYLAGHLLAMKRSTAVRLSENGNLFDERFFAYYEDVDLSQRAMWHGVHLKTIEGLGIYHFGGQTGGKLTNLSGVLKESRRKYAEKWNLAFSHVKGLDDQ